jgi:hypothetical protein
VARRGVCEVWALAAVCVCVCVCVCVGGCARRWWCGCVLPTRQQVSAACAPHLPC